MQKLRQEQVETITGINSAGSVAINKTIVSDGALDVDGDIYSNGKKVATEVDYSTSEHLTGAKWIDGSPIYRKVISIGTLPNNATKSVAHGITALDTVIHLYGAATSSANGLPIPYTHNTTNLQIVLNINSTDVNCGTYTDRTAYNGVVVIEYTKA